MFYVEWQVDKQQFSKNTQDWDKTRQRDLALSALLLVLLIWFLPLSVVIASEGGQVDGGNADSVGESVRQLTDLKSGSFVTSQTNSGFNVLPRINTDFSLKISGVVVQALVTQTFVNDTDQWIEGQYVFPLPPNSAVNGMKIRIGERVIVGDIKEKIAARKIFLKARQAGKKASLVEQQRPNLFTNRVTNIGPGERIDVEVRYLQTLQYDGGEFSLRLPMTITPRYIPGVTVLESSNVESVIQGGGWSFNTDQVSDASNITPPQRSIAELLTQNLLAQNSSALSGDTPGPGLTNTASIHLSLIPGFEIASLSSPYHDIQSERIDERYNITTKKTRVLMDRDFVLRWKPVSTQAPVAAFFNESTVSDLGMEEHHGLLMVMPPTAGSTQVSARELVLVIDTSGSMAGTSMIQAKQALLLALQRLRKDDYFNVIEFNSNTHQLFERSVSANDINIGAAKRYVNGLQANGGTEMRGALEAALKPSASESTSGSSIRQVVFITDGSVGNEEALFDYIVKSVGASRLFTVAIGASPNSYFMKKAAQFGRGVYTSIGSVRQVNQAMVALFEKIERPLLTDVKVTFHNSGKVEFYPEKVPDMYADEPLLLVARLSEQSDTVSFSGEFEGRYWQQDIVPHWGGEHQGVGTLWARQKIEHLMDESIKQGNKDLFRDEIVMLGVKHKVMSRYTSFVAVDMAPSRPHHENLSHQKIANSMPAGSTQSAPSVAYPTTAIGINGMLLSGVLSMFLALLIMCLKQDRHFLKIKYAVSQGAKK